MRPLGDRIIPDSIKDMFDSDLELQRIYTVVVNDYLSQGNDGFEVFKDPSIKKCNFSSEDEMDIREIVYYFLKTFQRTEEKPI